jgi:hypothetical protein
MMEPEIVALTHFRPRGPAWPQLGRSLPIIVFDLGSGWSADGSTLTFHSHLVNYFRSARCPKTGRY